MRVVFSRNYKYLAIFAVIVAIVFVVYKGMISPLGHGDEFFAVETTTKQLSDGSSVTLEKGSHIKLSNFDNGRSVEFHGRAYFEVQEDPERSFSIETKSGRIAVTGTSFMVDNQDENRTAVYVESGTVNLYQNPSAFQGSNMMVGITSGEVGELTVGTRGIRKRKIKDENYLAWKTGRLVFQNTYMTEVATTLEQNFGLKIQFSQSSIQRCLLDASYDFKTAEEVLKKIATTLDLNYEIDEGVVTFSGDGC